MGGKVNDTLRWYAATNTHRGRVRKLNEDALLARDDLQLWAVADGMGGHEAGDVASQMIVESLQSVADSERLSEFVDSLEDTLIRVNNDIITLAAEKYQGKTMGATIVLLAVRGRVGVCLWAGDSRLYRLRRGELKQLSRDHSQVQDLLSRGLLDPQDAENHPASNVITRAVGAAAQLYVDVTAFDVEPNDTYLLCSDGLYNELDHKDITACLSLEIVEQSANQLLEHALNNGARDNVSVVVSRSYC